MREADRIITIFTSTLGKVRAVAKGVRKTTSKLGGHLEFFNVLELELAEGRNLATITAARTIFNFPNLRTDLNSTSLAYYLIELVDKLTPEEHRDTRIFNLLVATLKNLDGQRNKAILERLLLVQSFKIKLLGLLGFAPQLTKCVQCHRSLIAQEHYYFSNLLGGILCFQCK
ncbi:MAG: DNA repair protein RecO, partial [Gammaproteobacteria bacterium RIFOXYB2_FULL_38_6]